MRPTLVISVVLTVPWSGVCRGSRGSGTGRAAGSSGVSVYWQGPFVTSGDAWSAAWAGAAAVVTSRPAASTVTTIRRGTTLSSIDRWESPYGLTDIDLCVKRRPPRDTGPRA